MNKKISAIILIAALITTIGGVAADQLGYFTINNSNVIINNSNVTIGQNNTITYDQPTPTSNTSSSSSSSSGITSTPMPQPLLPFNPTLTSTYSLNNTLAENGTFYLGHNVEWYTNGTVYFFSVTLTNPSNCADSSGLYLYQFIVIEPQNSAPLPSDVTLQIYLGPPGYATIPLTQSGSQLTGSCGNPFAYTYGPWSFPSFIVTSGYNQTQAFVISFSQSGIYNLAVNLVPTT